MSSIRPLSWRGEEISRVALGTAQLGLPYGVANTSGQPSQFEANRIVKAAIENGIRFFDTAQGYGRSEETLGNSLKAANALDSKIISKLVLPHEKNSEEIFSCLQNSTRKLGVPLWGILLHRYQDLNDSADFLVNEVSRWKAKGLIRHFGVSVYEAKDALQAIENPLVDIIQLPASILDTRAQTLGVFTKATELNKLCFVRSVYLQGLLTMGPSEAAKKVPATENALGDLQALAELWKMPLKVLAFRYALSLDCPLVVGAESAEQIIQTASYLEYGKLNDAELAAVAERQAPLPVEALNPSLWPKS